MWLENSDDLVTLMTGVIVVSSRWIGSGSLILVTRSDDDFRFRPLFWKKSKTIDVSLALDDEREVNIPFDVAVVFVS